MGKVVFDQFVESADWVRSCMGNIDAHLSDAEQKKDCEHPKVGQLGGVVRIEGGRVGEGDQTTDHGPSGADRREACAEGRHPHKTSDSK